MAARNEETMKRAIIGTVIPAGMLNAAHADTWVFSDTLRPNGIDRSVTVKRADGRKMRPVAQHIHGQIALVQCMRSYGWALDDIVPETSHTFAGARRSVHAIGARIDLGHDR
jgi:hypothetical protein